MKQEYLEKYADVLIWGMETARTSNGGTFKKGDVVLLGYDRQALPLAEIIFRKLIKKGIHVSVQMASTPQMEKDFFEFADDDQLTFLGEWILQREHHINGKLRLIAPDSMDHLKDVDPKKISKSALSAKPIRDIQQKREAKGEMGWSLALLATEANAEKAGMTVEEYEAEIIKACYLDEPDPVAVWQEMYERSLEIKAWLDGLDVDRFHVVSENTDLMITPGKDRKWLGFSGHNIPSFELFMSPDWHGTEGVYYANTPSFRNGNFVKGVRLVFKEGRVVETSAEEGEAFVRSQIDMDEGASQVGEFSLTDKRFSRISKFMAEILFDENVGGENGNCHIAVGASFPDSYAGKEENTKELRDALGFNDSSLHWDLINTEQKTVTAHLKDGSEVVIYKDGVFLYDEA